MSPFPSKSYLLPSPFCKSRVSFSLFHALKWRSQPSNPLPEEEISLLPLQTLPLLLLLLLLFILPEDPEVSALYPETSWILLTFSTRGTIPFSGLPPTHCHQRIRFNPKMQSIPSPNLSGRHPNLVPQIRKLWTPRGGGRFPGLPVPGIRLRAVERGLGGAGPFRGGRCRGGIAGAPRLDDSLFICGNLVPCSV